MNLPSKVSDEISYTFPNFVFLANTFYDTAINLSVECIFYLELASFLFRPCNEIAIFIMHDHGLCPAWERRPIPV